jgi:hypothetical protein
VNSNDILKTENMPSARNSQCDIAKETRYGYNRNIEKIGTVFEYANMKKKRE